jgi:hypothetical protein
MGTYYPRRTTISFSKQSGIHTISGKTDIQFHIPNYNGEQRFLQGNTSAGTKINPRVPEIYGTFGWTITSGILLRGHFGYRGEEWTDRGKNSGNNFEASLCASRASPISGAHSIVQSSAQNAFFNKIPITLTEQFYG